MTINLDALVGKQVNVLNTSAGGNALDVTNITVDSVDKAAGLITGHNGNVTYVVPVSALSVRTVGGSATAVINF